MCVCSPSGLTKSPSTSRSSAPASLGSPGSPQTPTVVQRVLQGSEAAASGLETGDALLSINLDGKIVRTTGMSLQQILVMLKNRPKDRPTTLVFKTGLRAKSPELSPVVMSRLTGNLKRIALGPGPLGMGRSS